MHRPERPLAYNKANANGYVVHIEGDKPILSTSLVIVSASIANAVAAAQKVVDEAQMTMIK